MKIETLPVPIARPAPPALNALQICNEKIVAAKASATSELKRLIGQRKAFESTPLVIPPGTSVAEQVRLQTEHTAHGHEVAYASRFFMAERFAAALLDAVENKPALEAGLRYLKATHRESLERKAAAPAKKELVPSGDEPHPEYRSVPHAPPSGGLYGVSEPLNFPQAQKRLGEAVAAFPHSESFAWIVSTMNRVASELREMEPPLPMPVRQDRPFIPLHG